MNASVALLRKVVMYGDDCNVKDVAEKSGLAESTVYDNLNGRNNPSIEVVKGAYLASRDPRLKLLLEPHGFELIEKGKLDIAPTDNWEKETGDVYIALSVLHSNVRKTLTKGKVDQESLVQIIRDVEAVGKELNELKNLAQDFLGNRYLPRE